MKKWCRIYLKKAVAHLSKIKCGAAFPKRGAPLIKKRSTAFTDKIVRGSILIERCAKYLVVVFGGGFIFSIQGNADN